MALRSSLLVGFALLGAFAFTHAAPRAEQTPAQPAKAGSAPADDLFARDIAPIFAKYCTSCHGGKRPKGDFSLEPFKTTADALKGGKAWEKVAHNLRTAEMPPAGKPKPTATEMDRIIAWIETEMIKVDCTKERDPGRVTLRRLNRTEYKNTIRDLLGIDFKPADDFPTDDVGYGFDNIGDVLSLSPLLLEKYLAAAEKIAEMAFKSPETRKRIVPQLPFGKKGKGAVPGILENFAKKAWRRPVTQDEVNRLGRFVELAFSNGEGFERGIQLAVQATLVSPHFLFRVERTLPPTRAGKTAFPITDYELASRLSYFLWSSMPDERLFGLAAEGLLREGYILEEQVKRMLRDPKALAVAENFGGQWLNIRNLKTKVNMPDAGTFKSFDEKLRLAMVRETELFFDAIVKEDRSILDFLDADFTFINERLAKHYGMKDIKGDEFRRVSLAGVERRGVLTHASILTVTSNPTRTSPVKRGKWILENILNTPPPPPPPDVPELDEQQAELKGTLRQRMEQHRVKPICASCHQRMDPLGFGFENFDAVGAWRTHEGKFPIDASGVLPSGQSFKGPRELVAILKAKDGEFRRCLAEKLLTYGLGRGLEYYDRCAVDDICAATVRGENRFSSLVLAIVRSEPFQLRKARP